MATMKRTDHDGGAVSVLVHNSKKVNHFVFGKESTSGGSGETLELQDLSKPAQRRKRQTSGSDDEEESFVVHIVEPHHTIRGIALQYRSTVEQIKRANSLWTDSDLHSHKTLKIPVVKHGILYNKFHSGSSEGDAESPTDATATTHTTQKMLREPKLVNGLTVPALPATAIDDSSGASSSEYLEKLDRQLATVIASQQALLSAHNAVSVPARDVLVQRDKHESMLHALCKDWRAVLLGLVLVLVLLPLLYFFVLPHVAAPAPHAPASSSASAPAPSSATNP